MKTNYLRTASFLALSLLALEPASARSFASSSFGGRTTTVTGNGDGTRTVSVVEMGRTTTTVRGNPPSGISVDDGMGGFKPYFAPPKSPAGASTNFDGKSISSTSDGNGTHTVTTTDATGTSIAVHPVTLPKGISVDDGKGGFKPYVAPPKSKVIASSTFDGKTTTVTDNGNGTHTVTVTDEDGNSTSDVHTNVR